MNPLPASHNLDFGSAKWIQPPKRTEGSYYRKNLYLAARVERAWVSIAATGSYELIVNNVIVDTNKFPGARPSGLYDVTRLLARGKNAIAVYIPGEWWTDVPQMRARGGYSLVGGSSVEFVSDSSWKVSEVGESIPRGRSWTAPGFDDSGWFSAVEGREGGRLSSVQGITYDPRLVEAQTVGSWISGADSSSTQMTFSYSLEFGSRPREGWLQIASNGTYDLLVNDQLAATVPMVSQALLFSASAPVVFPGRVFSVAELPRVFGPSSGLPGTLNSYSAVRVPASSFRAGKLDLQLKKREDSPEPRQASPSGLASLPSYLYSGSPVSKLPAPPVGPAESLYDYSYSWNPRLLQQLELPSEQAISIPLNFYASPLAMPGLGDIAPEPAPAVGQVIPLTTSPGPETAAGLALIGYEVSELLKAGTNVIRVRVSSAQPPPVVLVNGFVQMKSGDGMRFSSDGSWTAASGSDREHHLARVVGEHWAAPWGAPVRVAAYDLWLPWRGVTEAANWILSLTVVGLGTLLLWIVAGWLASLPKSDADGPWNVAAGLHLPILLAMLGCLLISYDVRMPYDWCFREDLVLAFGLALFGVNLVPFAQRCWPAKRAALSGHSPRPRRPGATSIVLLTMLMVVGFAIRVSSLTTVPLGHDEVELALSSKGILTRGFPQIVAGSYLRLLSTYELVPYPMALFSWILGPSLPWFRVPALIFGTLTIGLIGGVGYRLFDWRIGILAATVWTFLPIPVNWSADGFYPSQEAFFALTTFWLFYEAMRDRPLNARYLRWSTVAFILTYLSWEASGFIIFALLAALIVLRWREWDWIWDRNLWRCFAVISTVVVLQLCFRQLTLAPDYLGFIRDLSQLTTPAFVPFNRLVFDPLYYLGIFFFAENHVVLTMVTLAGLVVAWRKPPLLYLNVLLATLYLCYTCFLEHYAPRYCFNWLPVLVLAGAASLFSLFDLLKRITASHIDRSVRLASLALGVAFLVLGTNEYVLKLFRASADPADPVYFDRMGVQFKPNYGDADKYVAGHRWPGDIVVTRAPHVFLFATGSEPDYCFDPRLTMRLLFDGGQTPPSYIDKWLGVRQIRSLAELQELQARSRHVWIISDTLHDFRPLPFSQDVNNFLTADAKLVYESAAQRVFLLNGVTSVNAIRAGERGLRSSPGEVRAIVAREAAEDPLHVR